MFPSPANEGDVIKFAGEGTDDGSISGFAWRSDLDGDLGSTANIPTTALSNGTHTIFLKVQDDKGTWSEEVSTQITINGIPTARIVSISDDQAIAGNPVTFDGNGSDDDGISLFVWTSDLDGELFNGTPVTNTLATNSLTPGYHIITVRIQDDYEIWSQPGYLNVTINSMPVCKILEITPNPAKKGETIEFRASFTGDGPPSMIIWSSSISGQLYFDDELEFSTASLSPGNHTISLKVRDNTDLWSDIVTANLTILEDDGEKPTITITEPRQSFTIKGSLVAEGMAYDNTGIERVEIKIDGDSDWIQAELSHGGWSFIGDITMLHDGEHTIEARAYDGYYYSPIVSVTFKVDIIRDEDEKDSGNDKGFIPGFEVAFVVVGLLIALFISEQRRKQLNR